MVQVIVNKPNRPKGSAILVPGVGRLKNGEAHEVNEETVAMYDIPEVIGEPLSKSGSLTTPHPPVGSGSQEGASDAESLESESGNTDTEVSVSGEEAS